ncbi:MAG: DAK2 domain-containing protein [Lachnospiraceae bacterium]|nr:DAK2 domain-containing protein [Lachnospiraceae bacterium]
MAKKTIDAALLKKMFLAGAQRLEANKEWINELNVFPVPDGDTGTNMTLTIMSAAKEVQGIEKPDMELLAKAISSGSLRGARGNSGVILSQLLRGFTKEIKTVTTINVTTMANALQRAVETAYKAVMKPKEGTILTVAKGMADKATELVGTTEDLEKFFAAVIKHGDYVLSQTPEMLPVLKEAGVVDSGGQGLMEVFKGWQDAFLGKEMDLSAIPAAAPKAAAPKTNVSTEDFEITFGYCTEFVIYIDENYNMDKELEFKAFLESIGDSIVVVSDDDIVKVHVHTNDPGRAIQRALTYGPLTRMKIDNMREEHEEKLIKEASKKAAEEAAKKAETQKAEAQKPAAPRKPAGFVAISAGAGMTEIFKGLGVDVLIEGGQTMNPSADDIVQAIDQVNADVVYVLPNNKNIILAADQATYLVEDKQVVVVPSKTIPQGITAAISFMPGMSPEDNLAQMKEEMARVKTGQVTYAVRNTSLGGVEVHEGDIMGIDDHAILAVGKDIADTSFELLQALVDEDSELISIYYGEEVSEEDAEGLLARVEEQFPDLDVEMHSGGQPIYYYVMSVE